MINGHLPEMAQAPNWPALLRVAHELQTWTDALPVWSERSGEAWSTFKRRYEQEEQALATRLRRMPGCTMARSPSGSTTTLILAGIEAKAQGGAAAACRNWIAKVQRTSIGVSRPLV